MVGPPYGVPPPPPIVNLPGYGQGFDTGFDVTAVGASGGALGSGAGSDMHPCDGHECWSY